MSTVAPILIMAGGTGGHVFPGLAVADALRARGVPVVWLGTRAGLEARAVPAEGIPIEWLPVRGLRRNGVLGWAIAPFALLRATARAWRVIRRHRPRAVLGMGGYVAGPGGVAARLAGVPLVIHEQNAVAGLTNRILARLARRVLCGFEGAFGKRPATVTGNPVRGAIRSLPVDRGPGGDPAAVPRLLVIGGSLGALALNTAVPAAVAALPAHRRPVVYHQAGERTLETAQAAYRDAGVDAQVVPFIDDMAQAYRWADLVICRAGALTVSELAIAGVAAILVPLPAAVDDHQTRNARHLVATGGGWLLPQDALADGQLAALLETCLDDRAALRRHGDAARALAAPEAAEAVAEHCLEVAR